MTISIDLPPDLEAGLATVASRKGVSLTAYVSALLRAGIPENTTAPPNRRRLLPPDQRATAWTMSAQGLPDTPPLSDEAISRESIYSDRG